MHIDHKFHSGSAPLHACQDGATITPECSGGLTTCSLPKWYDYRLNDCAYVPSLLQMVVYRCLQFYISTISAQF